VNVFEWKVIITAAVVVAVYYLFRVLQEWDD
jgi:hypothetical protein